MNTNIIMYKIKELFPDFNDPLEYQEIGDGNINFVYRVSEASGKSVIVKLAADHIRSNVNRKLSPDRNRIEYEALKKQQELAPSMVPKVYYLDKDLGFLVMEDLKDYDILWSQLSQMVEYPFLARQISEFLYATLVKTTDICLDSKEKKQLVVSLANHEMCEITERVVFREPIFNLQNLNSCHPENGDLVKNNVYHNSDLIYRVAKLKDRYKNYAQSMLHGDLHSGSIFVNEKEIKVFDTEFSFYGPMGYDIGTILANLILNYVVVKIIKKEEKKYSVWLRNTICEIITGFIQLYNDNYEKDVIEITAKNKEFKEYYLKQILEDSYGYMGIEILRRTIGMAKTPEIKNIFATGNSKDIERVLISFSVDLLCDEGHQDIFQILNDLDARVEYEKMG